MLRRTAEDGLSDGRLLKILDEASGPLSVDEIVGQIPTSRNSIANRARVHRRLKALWMKGEGVVRIAEGELWARTR